MPYRQGRPLTVAWGLSNYFLRALPQEHWWSEGLTIGVVAPIRNGLDHRLGNVRDVGHIGD